MGIMVHSLLWVVQIYIINSSKLSVGPRPACLPRPAQLEKINKEIQETSGTRCYCLFLLP